MLPFKPETYVKSDEGRMSLMERVNEEIGVNKLSYLVPVV